MDEPGVANAFTRLLVEERPSATVAFLARAQADAAAELDRLARSVGFRGLGERWREINRDDAVRLLVRILRFNLAYRRSEEMTERRARDLAVHFVGSFTTPARWFTNGTFTPAGWSGWGKVGNTTFDAGVAALSDDLVGMLWVEDED